MPTIDFSLSINNQLFFQKYGNSVSVETDEYFSNVVILLTSPTDSGSGTDSEFANVEILLY